jgi:hypothetical protein
MKCFGDRGEFFFSGGEFIGDTLEASFSDDKIFAVTL